MVDAELERALGTAARAVEATLEVLLPRGAGAEARVCEAMRYAVFAGGKRLRPFLVLASAALFAVPEARALRVAAAIECVHTYSLVHDDLPAMDDDDLRRGRPTCHKAFDEATAILAGDGLLTLAFEVLADPATHPDGGVRAALVAALARGAGADGMVGGQMIDLMAEGKALTLHEIRRLQRMKTGALFGFSAIAGAVLGEASAAARTALGLYADALGLAFQIADDLLDVEGDAAAVGKAVQKDAAAGKATFVQVLGVDGARAEARACVASALEHLDLFGHKAEHLRWAAEFVIARRA
ncbi:MAG: polyprenyl synthetase family protein [Alphaproteobacteria bacterium]|nr:polyprenyl synthetase family protein [Alphaproteobacteria bacterium]